MSDKMKVSGNGLGFATVLGLIFITLKLMGYINWSWWWVLAPIYLPFAILAVIFGGVFIWTMLDAVFKNRRIKARRNRTMH